MTRHKTLIAASIAGLFLLLPALATGQSLYGDFVKPPTDYKRGFHLGTDLGMVFFLNTGGQISNPGFSLAFFLGYDILKYVSVEARFMSALANAAKTEPLNGGVYAFQTNGLVRLSYPIKRFFPFVDFGAGIFFMDPELAAGLGGELDLEIGYGLEYYTYQRHFSIGFRGSYIYVNGIMPEAMAFNLTLKYTF